MSKAIEDMTRDELNKELLAISKKEGEDISMKDIEALPNKDAVIDVINGLSSSKEEEETEETSTSGDSVDILVGEEYIRTYSKEIHGKDFKSLAKQFISQTKWNGKAEMKADGSFDALLVAYRERKTWDKEAGIFKDEFVWKDKTFNRNQGAEWKDKALEFYHEKQAHKKAIIKAV